MLTLYSLLKTRSQEIAGNFFNGKTHISQIKKLLLPAAFLLSFALFTTPAAGQAATATLTLTSGNANPSYAKYGDNIYYTLTATNGNQLTKWQLVIEGGGVIGVNGVNYPSTSGSFPVINSSYVQWTDGPVSVGWEYTSQYGKVGFGYSSSTIIYDGTPPAVTIGAPSANIVPGNGKSSVSYAVTYADDNFNTSNLTTSGLTLNTTGTATGTLGISGSGTSYIVTISNISGNGTLGISVGAGYAVDLAGNTEATGAGPSSTVTVLPNVPSSISYTGPNAYPINLAISPLAPAETVNTSIFASTTSGTGLALDYNGNAYIIASTSEIIQYQPGNSTAFPLPANSSANIAVAPISATSSTLLTAFNGAFRAMDIYGGPNDPPVTICSSSGTGNLIAATHPASGPEIAMINKGYDQSGQIAFFTRTAGVWSSPAIITNAFPGSALAINDYQGGLKLAYIGTDNNLYYATFSGGAWSAVSPWGAPNISLSGVTAFALDAQGDVWYGNGAALNELAPGSTSPITAATLPSAPNAIAFDITGNLYVDLGTTIEQLAVINNFQVNPGLPAGLSISSGTGVISGTPTAVSPATNYTVTAAAGSNNLSATVNIQTQGLSNANLSALALNTGILKPVFDPATIAYGVPVGNTVTTITVTPTAADPAATITVNGTTVVTGTASAVIPLNVGANAISIVTTAGDGVTKKTYTVTVTRAQSGNDNLSALSIHQVAISPAFLSHTTAYTATVANASSSIVITATTSEPNAIIKINGVTTASGVASAPVAVNVGDNTITIAVTAQNGANTLNYTIDVTRKPSTNDALTTLQMKPFETIIKTTGPDFGDYTVSVPNNIASISVIATATDPTASITVNGTAATSGIASPSVALTAGPNTITTTVTAQDGVTTRNYVITVTRAPSSNAILTKLSTSPVETLTPVSGPGYKNYTASVPNTVTLIKVFPVTEDPTATVKVNGVTVASGSGTAGIHLAVGSNTITTVVTAQDGITMNSYIMTITRATAGATNIPDEEVAVATTDSPTLNDDGILVHQAVSPNGDGVNDYLTIENIASYPDNKLMIMNPGGRLVYETKGYDNQNKVFDGHSNKNGQKQQPGTYFYSLDYTVKGIIKHKTGFIVLKY